MDDAKKVGLACVCLDCLCVGTQYASNGPSGPDWPSPPKCLGQQLPRKLHFGPKDHDPARGVLAVTHDDGTNHGIGLIRRQYRVGLRALVACQLADSPHRLFGARPIKATSAYQYRVPYTLGRASKRFFPRAWKRVSAATQLQQHVSPRFGRCVLDSERHTRFDCHLCPSRTFKSRNPIHDFDHCFSGPDRQQ